MTKFKSVLSFIFAVIIWTIWPISGVFACSPRNWDYSTSEEVQGGLATYIKGVIVWIFILILVIWAPHFIQWGLELY